MKPRHTFQRSLLIAAGVFFIALSSSNAADFEAANKEWRIDSAQTRQEFEATAKVRTTEGLRLADVETYRVDRDTRVTSVWVKPETREKSQRKDSMSIGTLTEEHRKQRKKGYSMIEVEATRLGATLEFAAVWAKGKDVPETEFYWGMDSLLFSNRYGEMADKGFRLIDFEAYNGAGKALVAGIWAPKEDLNVRFFRGLAQDQFLSLAETLEAQGFGLIDIESYRADEEEVFAGSWIELEENQVSAQAFDLKADSFYLQNAKYAQGGYRLIDFETYSRGRELRYAGSWIKDTPAQPKPEPAPFIEKFRNPGE